MNAPEVTITVASDLAATIIAGLERRAEWHRLLRDTAEKRDDGFAAWIFHKSALESLERAIAMIRSEVAA